MKLNHLRTGYHLMGTVLLACCASLPARADYQSTVVSQAPVGYYRLSETVAPPSNAGSAVNLGSLGTTANGVYNNYPTRGLTGPFTGSSGIQVDGSGQSIQAPYDAALNPGTWTIEAWVQTASATPPGNLTCALASMHSGDPRSGWLVYQSGGLPDTAAAGWELRLYAQNSTATSLRVLVTGGTTPGTWHHLVYTYDGTTAKGYLDGALSNQGNGAFVGNVDAKFSLGARSDNGFPWSGQLAEVAYYSGALSAAQVASHYSTATSNPAGYAAEISGASPLVYYRFLEPADPVAANAGTLGASGNALYIYNALPGQAGPSSPTYTGFEAANKAVGFDGTGGSVLVPALNLNTNTVTITGWIKPNGVQPASTGLIMSRAGTTTAGLTIDIFPGLGLGYNWNNDGAAYNWSPSADSGLPQMADGVWNFAALVVGPDKAAIYIANSTDPNSFIGATNNIPHANQAFNGKSVIGLDPGFTTRNFNGAIDEVTFFKRSLGAGELYTEFASAVGNVAAKIFSDPQAPANTLFDSDSLTLRVDAGGTPPLTYVWRKNTIALPGATDSAYTNASLVATDSGNYDVIVTSASGAPATSAAASIVVNPVTPPSISQNPVGRTLYAGGKLALSVQASGGQLTYYWQKNGSPVGVNSSTYVVNSVAAGDAGNYVVIVSNRLSTATSAPAANVVVITPAAGSYEATILADTPQSWWRLNETSGTDMFDGLGRNDGYYTNSGYTMNSPGVIPGNPGVADDGTPDFFALVPFNSDLTSTEFTLECWAKVPDGANNYCPISFYEAAKHGEFYYADSGAGSWRGAIGAGADPYLFYYLGDTPGANIVPDKWMHLVLTYGTSIGLRCYVNGQWSGTSYGDFPRNASGALKFGGVGPAISYKFSGTVDDVVYYKHSLTPAQAQAHYVAALFGSSTAPFFTIQPASQSVLVGANVTFTGFADGTAPITYQWLKDGVAIAGKTTTSLTLNNVSYADIAAYRLRAMNSAGTNPSSIANLVVGPPAAFANATNELVLHLRFDGNYNDTSGRGNNGTPQGAPSLSAGKIGSGAFHYSTDTGGGTFNYLTLGDPTDLHFGASTSFSVAYWVKLPAGYALGDLPFLCSAANSYGNEGFTFAPTYGPGGGTAGGWSWYIKDDANHAAGLYGPGGSINNGQWHHLVHSFDRTGSANTYLDGTLVNTTTITAVGNIDTAGPVNIGQDPTGAYPESGSGDLDDIGVWRRALTQSEAASIYAVGQNFGNSFDTYGPVTVYLSPLGSDYVIVWQAGTLLESSSPTGPWTPVAGAVAPNYRFTPSPSANKFYKVQL